MRANKKARTNTLRRLTKERKSKLRPSTRPREIRVCIDKIDLSEARYYLDSIVRLAADLSEQLDENNYWDETRSGDLDSIRHDMETLESHLRGAEDELSKELDREFRRFQRGAK